MARSSPTLRSSSSRSGHQVRICFERILPDDVDPERAVRHTLRDRMTRHMTASIGRTLSTAEESHVARMAVVESKKWQPGSTVRCRFLDGSQIMKKKVQTLAHRWERYADVKFKFVAGGPADVRVSFYADAGSWSAVGRDALNQSYFPLHQPTMNFGWLRDNTDAEESSRVVLHEFGHALGCVHEHQSPTFDRTWNRKAVMQYFQGPPNYWSPAEIESNVLGKYSPTGISATRFDPKSIMLYEFDAALFSDGLGPTNSNTQLSEMDVGMIKEMYP